MSDDAARLDRLSWAVHPLCLVWRSIVHVHSGARSVQGPGSSQTACIYRDHNHTASLPRCLVCIIRQYLPDEPISATKPPTISTRLNSFHHSFRVLAVVDHVTAVLAPITSACRESGTSTSTKRDFLLSLSNGQGMSFKRWTKVLNGFLGGGELLKRTHNHQITIVRTVKGRAMTASTQVLAATRITPLSSVCTNSVEKKF